MRTGLTTVYAPDALTLGDYVDDWENDDGSLAYGYDSVTIDDPVSTTGARIIDSHTGTIEVGDLVRIENIPMGHRHHTHRQWAVGPVEGIWAVPREKIADDDGRTETIDHDARDYDPESPADWPGVAVACEVYAPRLGGDVPVGRCQPFPDDAAPDAYIERYGDDRTEGLWVDEPIRKDETNINDHLPNPEDDDRTPDYIGTDGAYDTFVEMRADLMALPADDPNAADDNPETDRPMRATILDDHLEVKLLGDTGEQRLHDVAAAYDATVEQVATDDTAAHGIDTPRHRYHVTVADQ